MERNYYSKFIGMLLFCISALFITSCSQKVPENATAIPKESRAVFVIDLYSLAKKGKLKEFSEMKFVKTAQDEMKNENKDLAKLMEDVMDNPGITGLDIKTDVFGFYVQEGENEIYACASIKLNNEKKFTEFVKNILTGTESSMEIQNEGGFSYLMENDEIALAWDAKKLLFIMATSYGSRENLQSQMATLMTLTAEDQITKNESFNKFYTNKKDVSLWFSMNFIQDNYALLNQVSGAGMADFYKDSYYSLFLDFQKGKVSLAMQVTPSEKMAEMMEKFKGKDVSFNSDLLQFLPEQAMAAISAAFDPAAISLLFEENGTLTEMYPEIGKVYVELGKIFQEKTGMSIKELCESFKGSMLFTWSDVRTVESTRKTYDYNITEEGEWERIETGEETVENMMPIMGLVFDLNNSQFIEKAIAVIEETGQLEKKEGYYQFAWDKITVLIAFNEKACLVTNDEIAAAAFQNGGLGDKSMSKNPLKSNFSKGSGYAFWNLNLNDYPQTVQDQLSNPMVGMWKTFPKSFEVKQVNDNTAEMVFNLQDEDNNSLYTIIKLTTDFYNLMTAF